MTAYRIVNTSLWDDKLVSEKFSAEDKYFMLFLLTNRHTTQLGIYSFPIKHIAVDMGVSNETVMSCLSRFQKLYGIVAYSEKSGEIAVMNYLRHSIIKGGTPVFDCLVKEANQVKDKTLLAMVVNHLSNYEIKNKTVLDFIDYLKENIDIDVCNVNNNEESYHDSLDDSSSKPKTKRKAKAEEPKKKYGEFGNVLLTETEYIRLGEDYGEEKRDAAIKYLDLYIPDKGYKSKSHNMAMRRWVFNAIEEKEGRGKNGNTTGNTSSYEDECRESERKYENYFAKYNL